MCIFMILLWALYFRWKILYERRRRQARDAIHELNDRPDDDGNKDGPQTHGVVQNAAPAAAAEVEGSSAGPVELDADQIQEAPASPRSSVVTVRDLSPDSNPLHEPTGRPGSLYEADLGAH